MRRTRNWKSTGALEGTVSKDGEITAKLVHLKPAGYASQIRTGNLSADGKSIAGQAAWATGRDDFTRTLKQPYGGLRPPLPH